MINELVEKSAILPKRCRDIAEGFTEISDMTTTAGVTVIDTVLSGLDPNWFQKFKKEEKGVTPESNRIVNETRDEKVPSPYNMDFQAVMKMFNFRKEKVEPINEAYSLGITPSNLRLTMSDLFLLLKVQKYWRYHHNDGSSISLALKYDSSTLASLHSFSRHQLR